MSVESRGYRLAPLAEADLEEVWLYTFRTWSLRQADSYHGDLVTAFEELGDGTKTGRPVDVRDGYYRYAVGKHVVFYRRLDSGIEVMRILHQRMDVNRHL